MGGNSKGQSKMYLNKTDKAKRKQQATYIVTRILLGNGSDSVFYRTLNPVKIEHLHTTFIYKFQQF